ncbi:hypothetical protein [Gynuella sp.]
MPDVATTDILSNCQTFYRGDVPGKTEFWAHESGGYGKWLLEDNPKEYLMQQHAMDSSSSPYISLTTDIRVAEHFSSGQVYVITLPIGMAFPNPYNTVTLPGTIISESEWLVPLHIPSKYVNNSGCTCE